MMRDDAGVKFSIRCGKSSETNCVADIRILPEHVVNQIAAGEVVERAASVLKELVENALDAGAKRIQILVEGSGQKLVQVVDDGCGMSRENAHLAFERHATSKLMRAEDLYAIHSLGFRGEALPSIASVSFVELRTSTAQDGSGILLRLEAGNIGHEERIAAVPGTSIAVHSLFFNTPARARFLKSAATEFAHLVRVFKQYALAYPEIAWMFSHDGAQEFNLPSGSLAERLEDLFGAGFSDKLLWVNETSLPCRISGVIGKSELYKRSRGDQFLFLNRRPIQSPLIHSAVKAALREQLEEGQWPFYVLAVDMRSEDVDVNVHPAKLEVKFADERLVHGAVYRALRTALPAQVTAEPLAHGFTSGTAPSVDAVGAMLREHRASGESIAFAPELPLTEQTNERRDDAMDSASVPLFRPAIFQVHDKYLISQISSGVAIIDQHAAHERILYERALKSFDERMFLSQQLLFPMLLELDPEEDAVFQELNSGLGVLGYRIREFGVRAYSIEAVPAGLKRVGEAQTLRTMIEEYLEFRRSNFAPREALAAGFACRAAIRAGDSLTQEEMSQLVDELFATQFPLTCPHGRPTVIHIKLSELDRRFKRTE
jgi:DNA mismatch repair protein MutL